MSKTKKTTQKLEFTVSSSFSLPSFYTYADASQIEEAILMGALVCDTVVSARASAEIQELLTNTSAEKEAIRQQFTAELSTLDEKLKEQTKRSAELIRDIEQQKETDIQYIKSQSLKKISELQLDIDNADKQRHDLLSKHAKEVAELQDFQKQNEGKIRQAERELTVLQMNQRIQQLQTEIHLANERNSGLLERKTQLETSRDADIQASLEHAEKQHLRELAEKDKTNQQLQKMLDQLTADMRRLSDSVTRKSANAKLKGNEFEAELRAMLIRCFGTSDKFSLVDSSHSGIGHEGDEIMKWGNEYILWEAKNYDNTIPTKEVEKFCRDMRENKHIRVGVMISKCSGITGKTDRGDLKTEFVDDQMFIYISRFDNFHEGIIPFLLELFHVWWNAEKTTEKDERKESAIHEIEELYNTAQNAKLKWRQHKSHMMDGLQFMTQIIEDTESTIQRTLKNLRAGATTSVQDVPDSIFRPSHGDEKMEQTIQILLEDVVVKETGQILLNELADRFAKRKTVSKDTAKVHIKAVLQDSALISTPGKPTMVVGFEFRSGEANIMIRS